MSKSLKYVSIIILILVAFYMYNKEKEKENVLFEIKLQKALNVSFLKQEVSETMAKQMISQKIKHVKAIVNESKIESDTFIVHVDFDFIEKESYNCHAMLIAFHNVDYFTYKFDGSYTCN